MGNQNNSRLIAEILLAYILQKNREFMFAHTDNEIEESDFTLFIDAIRKYTSGTPLSYLTKTKNFYGLDFYIDERVLIPRPETEMIVAIALDFLKTGCGNSLDKRILDIGTGSGCIAISILKNCLECKASVSDISKDALDVAKMNADFHKVSLRMSFVHSDLLNEFSDDENFDVVCANLPYIGKSKHNYVDKLVLKSEPKSALFSGNNGLLLYKKLFQQLSRRHHFCRVLIGEFGFGQEDDVRKLLNKYFEHKYRIEKDAQNISRVFVVNV